MVWWLTWLACVSAPTPVPPVPDGAEALWLEPGATLKVDAPWRMVPPTALPSTVADRDQVEVWVGVNGPGDLDVDASGALRWPSGAVAHRVEFRGAGDARRIVDVRGTTIDAEGRAWDHVYRPMTTRAGGALRGVRWRQGDTAARTAAVAWLRDAMFADGPQADEAPERRAAWADNLERKSTCTRCHVPGRPANRVGKTHGLVHRGTDATGWFTPQSVLQDELPVEAYGRHDRNLHPHLTVRCGEAPAVRRDGKWQCQDDVVPWATWDMAGALEAGDARAHAVCESRMHLASRMTEQARRRHQAALEACHRAEK